MDFSELTHFVQQHFTDGLRLVIGSGLSAAEGVPGMPQLAAHLGNSGDALKDCDAYHWTSIKKHLDAGDGLETALQKSPPPPTLETWIAKETCALLLPKEREVMSAVIRGDHSLRLTTFLTRILKQPGGLPILTTNYDRLVELACEMAGLHVDTTAVGHYAGEFDHHRSCMGSCRGAMTRGKTVVLAHYPRAIVLKPHGSFDWYRSGKDARRCSLDLDGERLIITPGVNKLRAGYDAPFDKHRELANNYIDVAGRLLIVGYGFNDDHLQTHLVKQIRGGTPTLILNKYSNPVVNELASTAPRCVALSQPTAGAGVVMITKTARFEQPGADLWDLGVLTAEFLA